MKYPFVVVEGFDGAGKTDASRWITNEFGYTYVKSPTGVFATARDIFDNLDNASVRERFFYYLAVSMSSAATAKEMLERGVPVLFDRYFYSTIVYHEILEPGITLPYKKIVSEFLRPDLVLHVVTDYKISNERLKKRKNGANDELFFRRERFDKAMELYPESFAALPPRQLVTVGNNGTFEELTRNLGKILRE